MGHADDPLGTERRRAGDQRHEDPRICPSHGRAAVDTRAELRDRDRFTGGTQETSCIVTGGYPPVRPVYAVRAGARGDISLPEGKSSSEAIAWSHDRDGTYISTPIVYRDQLYTLNNNGVLTAYAADRGERLFRARVGGGGAFSASPVAADGRLYMANEDGDVVVVQAGREYVELARNSMGEVIMATPAISDGVIVVRTLGHIWGIGPSRTIE